MICEKYSRLNPMVRKRPMPCGKLVVFGGSLGQVMFRRNQMSVRDTRANTAKHNTSRSSESSIK